MDVDRNGSIDAADAQYTMGYYMDILSKITKMSFDAYMFTGYCNYV